jgi:hypothetical protein
VRSSEVKSPAAGESLVSLLDSKIAKHDKLRMGQLERNQGQLTKPGVYLIDPMMK